MVTKRQERKTRKDDSKRQESDVKVRKSWDVTRCVSAQVFLMFGRITLPSL